MEPLFNWKIMKCRAMLILSRFTTPESTTMQSYLRVRRHKYARISVWDTMCNLMCTLSLSSLILQAGSLGQKLSTSSLVYPRGAVLVDNWQDTYHVIHLIVSPPLVFELVRLVSWYHPEGLVLARKPQSTHMSQAPDHASKTTHPASLAFCFPLCHYL